MINHQTQQSKAEKKNIRSTSLITDLPVPSKVSATLHEVSKDLNHCSPEKV